MTCLQKDEKEEGGVKETGRKKYRVEKMEE